MTPARSIREELEQIEAARHDPQAFAPLYEAYVDLVWRFALSRMGDPDRAADITSTTFVQAIRALPNFQPRIRDQETTFRPWLMTIAHNAVVSEWRRDRPTSPLHAPAVEASLASREPSPEERAIASDERDRVLAALAQLSPAQRQIVELRLAGLKAAEIAELLEMTVSAVNTAHFRAYARLRDLLGTPIQPTGERRSP